MNYEQLGREAHGRGERRLVPGSVFPGENPNRPVGDRGPIENAKAWYRGWDSAALAPPATEEADA